MLLLVPEIESIPRNMAWAEPNLRVLPLFVGPFPGRTTYGWVVGSGVEKAVSGL